MNVTIKPLGDRVLVEVDETGEETRSGIIIPKSSEESGGAVHIGKVIAVGDGRETDNGTVVKPKVAVGQKVAFSWGEKIEVGGKEYHLVGESSLLGILQDGNAALTSGNIA
ncbi:MAG: co-chaperone GroES [Candidatus Kaiserbacteria bacterium]|nr:co-chaperone GroES [Candidatus Kaiserbacteria bacterium]